MDGRRKSLPTISYLKSKKSLFKANRSIEVSKDVNENCSEILKKIERNAMKLHELRNILHPSNPSSSQEASSNLDEKIKQARKVKDVKDNFMSVQDLLLSQKFKWKQISFGCDSLDKCTGGGVFTRGITEIYGESGAGKSQIALQLSLMVQLPEIKGGLNKGTVYINTEGNFPVKRLQELFENLKTFHPELPNDSLNNVLINRLYEMKDLRQCTSVSLPKLLNNKNIGLIVIDSMAGIFRLEEDYIRRAYDMRKIVQDLHTLIDRYNCSVVCTNQVSSVLGNINTLVPCLGVSWSHLVRTRLEISKVRSVNDRESANQPIRQMTVIYSPDVPALRTTKFCIMSCGIMDVR